MAALPDLRRDLESAGLTCSRLEVDRDDRRLLVARQQQSPAQQPGQQQPGSQQPAASRGSGAAGRTAAAPWSPAPATADSRRPLDPLRTDPRHAGVDVRV